MQRGRGGGRGDFFGFGGDPFAGFGGFGRPGSLMSSFFGGRDPFDDPFFSNPMGSVFGSGNMFPSMFGPSMFGSPFGHPENAGFLEDRRPEPTRSRGPFGHPENAGFLEDRPPEPTRSRGPIIQELSSDSEGEGGEGEGTAADVKKEKNRKRNDKEPYVNDPDEECEDKRRRSSLYAHNFGGGSSSNTHCQPRAYSFQSSKVTYSGPNGAYYTASNTRRSGGDGVIFEESKEADTTSGKATHRVSKGLREKGHSVTRRLKSDGTVDTMQTLHNLNEDELSGFDETWKGNAKQHLPGWRDGSQMLENGNRGGSTGRGRPSQGWALPYVERDQMPGSGSRNHVDPKRRV